MADLSETFDKLRRMNKYNTLVSGLPRPLLVDAKSGVPNVLVEVSDPSGQHDHQYYIWNQLTDYVSEVLSPKTAKKIVPLLLTNGKTKEGLVIRKLDGFASKVLAPKTAEEIIPLLTKGGEMRGGLDTRLLESIKEALEFREPVKSI